MLARLSLLMPYAVTLPEGEEFAVPGLIYSDYPDYHVLFLPPARDPSNLHGVRPSDLQLDGKPAFEANVLRIDFSKESFNRNTGAPLDPPEELVRRAANEIHARLRFVARAAHAHPIPFPENHWTIEYTHDDGSALQSTTNFVTKRGSLQFRWSFIGLSKRTWSQMFELPAEFDVPVWDTLRLDALASLPSIGTAVVLAASALEVFIGQVLDEIARDNGPAPSLWKWITNRDGRIHQQPTVEEQFDTLLYELTGHSLKEESQLWESFKNLKAARNSFVHEGKALVGKAELTANAAAELLRDVDKIIARVREWIPESRRWPAPQTGMQFSFTHPIMGPSTGSQAVAGKP